jgi:hypothetical protein
MSSSAALTASALAWARQAHDLVQARPREALALAERALAAAAAEQDAEAGVAARHVLGWAQFELGDARSGKATLRDGIRLAELHGDRRGAGLVRRHLAFQLASDGQVRAAQREIATAISLLPRRDRVRTQVHSVEIHRRARTVDPEIHRRVLVDTARALRSLRRDGDELWEARLLHNRGALHFDRGELALAEADFCRAQTLYERQGAMVAVAEAAAVVAEIRLERGEIVQALAALDGIEQALPPGEFSYNAAECRVLALARAHLVPEARAAAEAQLAHRIRIGRGDVAAAAMLDLIDITLMSGDLASARKIAARATRSFAARGDVVNAALTRVALLRARLLDGSVGASSLRSGLAAAAVLETAGRRIDALRTRLLVARLALTRGALRTARAQLELVRPLSRRGLVGDRIELCLAQALTNVAEGNRGVAQRQLRRGLQLVDDFRGALGAVELRAAASGIGVELAERGLELAVEGKHPEKVLDWAELMRANALRLPSVRPPADPKLRRLQSELRRVTASRVRGSETARTRLEMEIRARTRLVAADGSAPSITPSVAEAARQLGDRALVEYVACRDGLWALTLADGKLERHELEWEDARSELDWLHFSLARLASGSVSADQRASARANAGTAAAVLDRLLVEPLLPTIGGSPLVVVPTGVLHSLPWGALPSLSKRPIVVAPSLTSWVSLAARPRSRRRKVALAAGPRLRHAAGEVRELASMHPHAKALWGKAATASAVLAALDGAVVAHLACHGHFRADSPLFSSLELADGPLNVYELQRLRHVPEIVILSACDLARSKLHPGDELLGLATALLGMGARTIVASILPAPDASAKRLMLAFHRNLIAGYDPAEALASARRNIVDTGFICLGTG